MLKLSNGNISDIQVGTTVRVPMPDVDRAHGSPRNILAVVSSSENGLYKLCKYFFHGWNKILIWIILGTSNGTLNLQYMNSIHVWRSLYYWNTLVTSIEEKKYHLEKLQAQNTIFEGQGYKRCHCKKNCKWLIDVFIIVLKIFL